MAAPRLCPECSGLLEDDGSCSCGYKPAKRGARRDAGPAPVQCSWDDHGTPCPCRGILSHTTNGDGAWYCREHWDRIQGREATVVGNALPPTAKRPTESTIEYMKRVGK